MKRLKWSSWSTWMNTNCARVWNLKTRKQNNQKPCNKTIPKSPNSSCQAQLELWCPSKCEQIHLFWVWFHRKKSIRLIMMVDNPTWAIKHTNADVPLRISRGFRTNTTKNCLVSRSEQPRWTSSGQMMGLSCRSNRRSHPLSTRCIRCLRCKTSP